MMNWWILKRRVHTSWLVAIVCLGIFIGVCVAQFMDSVYTSSVIVLAIALILIVIVFWRKYIYLIPFLIVGGILIGLWRGSISQGELTHYKPFYGKSISLSGTVTDDIDTGTSGQIIIRLGNIVVDNRSLSGTLWVTASSAVIKRSDRLELHGKLGPGFGNFAGVIYRATVDKVVHPHPGDIALAIRNWFANATRLAIPDPESSLGLGLLVGQRRALPTDLITALKLAGLTHIVVASGYNLTILVRLTRRLFTRVSKYVSALSAVAMILAFMAITGVSPSMSRAGLVSGLSLAAWYYGRKFHPLVLLSVAVAVTVLINPSYAWGDLGWQLSFTAFAGVMILGPLLQRYLFGDKKPGVVQQILVETVSAQIATAPILIAAFSQLSNVAIVSNLLVLPLVPLAMLLTFVAGVGGLVLPMLAVLIGTPASWLLHYMVSVTEYLASLPWAISKVQLAWWGVAICYAFIVSACLYMWRVTKYNLRDANLVE